MADNNALALMIKPPEVQPIDLGKTLGTLANLQMAGAHAGLYSLQAAQQARILRGYDVWQKTGDIDEAVKAGLPPEVPHTLQQNRLIAAQIPNVEAETATKQFGLSNAQAIRDFYTNGGVAGGPKNIAPGMTPGASPASGLTPGGTSIPISPRASAAPYLTDPGSEGSGWAGSISPEQGTTQPRPPMPAEVAGTPLWTPAGIQRLAQMHAAYGDHATAAQYLGILKEMQSKGTMLTSQGIQNLPGYAQTLTEQKYAEARGESQGKLPAQLADKGFILNPDGSVTQMPGYAAGLGAQEAARSEAKWPFQVSEAIARNAGRSQIVKPGEAVTTGVEISPAVKTLADEATRRILGGTPGPTPATPGTSGNVRGTPVGVVHMPDGSVTSSVTQSDVETANAVSKFRDERMKEISGYGDLRYAMGEARTALRQFPTGPGTDAVNVMAERIAKATGWDLNAILPQGYQADPTKYAIALKNIDRLAAAYAKGAFPQRITNNDLVLAMRANISVLNTNGANEKIMDSLEAVAKMRQEEGAFLRDYKFSPGHLQNWDIERDWTDHLAKMDIPQNIKDAYIAESDLRRNGIAPTKNEPWPEGAISAARGKNGEMAYRYGNPGGGYYWGPAKGTIVNGHEYLGGDPNNQKSWKPIQSGSEKPN